MASDKIKRPIAYRDITISLTATSANVIDWGLFSDGTVVSIAYYYDSNDWYYTLVSDSVLCSVFVTDANHINLLKNKNVSSARSLKCRVGYIPS